MTARSLKLRVVWLLGFVLAFGGCGPSKGEIEGTVEYDGKPLTSGAVIFMGQDEKPRRGRIEKDGTYRISDCPTGMVRISVRTRASEPEGFAWEGPAPKSTIPTDYMKGTLAIPRKYEDLEQSGLTYQVTVGKQTHNIKLPRAREPQ